MITIDATKITDEMKDIMDQNEHLFTTPKQVWTTKDLNEVIYRLINLYDGTNKKDNGCGGCRTTAVTKARHIYAEYKRQ